MVDTLTRQSSLVSLAELTTSKGDVARYVYAASAATIEDSGYERRGIDPTPDELVAAADCAYDFGLGGTVPDGILEVAALLLHYTIPCEVSWVGYTNTRTEATNG